MFLNKKVLCSFFGIAAFACAANAQINITGSVLNANGDGVADVTVSLAVAGTTTTTDAQGAFSLIDNTAVRNSLQGTQSFSPVVVGSSVQFAVQGQAQQVKIDVCDLNGRLVSTLLDRQLAKGSYSYTPALTGYSAKLYLVKAQIGPSTIVFKMPSCGKSAGVSGLKSIASVSGARSFAKRTDVSDTIIAKKTGYVTQKKSIISYTLTNQNLVLAAVPPASEIGVSTERISASINWGTAAVWVWDPAPGTQLQGAYTADKYEGTKCWQVVCAGAWSGWGIAATATDGVDMSGYAGGKLHLAVKGDALSVGVEVTCNVQGATQVVDLANYGYVPGDGQWHVCDIPFSDMGSLVFSNVTYYVAFVCPAATGGAYTMGQTYMVDDITWVPAQQ